MAEAVNHPSRGGKREGAGKKPSTVKGLVRQLSRLSPQRAEKLQRDMQILALETLVEWARNELRRLKARKGA
jgi:hypothetical protein